MMILYDFNNKSSHKKIIIYIMKKPFLLYSILSICFLFILNISLNQKNESYSAKLYQLIKSNSISGEVDLKNIKVKNKNFKIFFIKIKEQDQNSSNSIKLPVSKKFFEKHKVINVTNNLNSYRHSLLIISRNKYFNNLKFIFSHAKLNHKDVINIFEDKHEYFNKFNEDREDAKYLLKKNQILNCKTFHDRKANLRYCDKKHHIRIKNYELPDIIFETYKYFYLKIADDIVKFSIV